LQELKLYKQNLKRAEGRIEKEIKLQKITMKQKKRSK
jgi:hypothetical protein